MPAKAFFLDAAGGGAGGQRFCLLHEAQGAESQGLVLYIHPFAEEMNKARRMAALQSRVLAGHGFDVLQIDLHGCGDSSDDFGNATWEGWLDDVMLGCRWLQRLGDAPLWFWGLRVGCLLGCEAARRLDTASNFLFWQPTLRGKSALQQFLRIKVTADMLSEETKISMESLRRELASGRDVEIAGYTLGPGLALGLEQAALEPPSDRGGRLVWLEIASAAMVTMTLPAQQAIEGWQHAGYDVASKVVEGPAFWQTTEIEEAPRLVDATLKAMRGHALV